jgi:AbiV family abortive infection protein
VKEGGISKYKLVRMASEALRNSLRLHFDAVLLYENASYPSAFQLSVLSLEEFAKAKWVEDYVWTSETNGGYPDEDFEQKWLGLLYSHPEKQWAFIAREVFDYSPRFADFIKHRQLEEKKQRSVYVGLARNGRSVDVKSRISTPTRIGRRDASQLISLVNSEFLAVCKRLDDDDQYFDIAAMDAIFDRAIHIRLLKWKPRTGLKSRRWTDVWFRRSVS